MVLNIKQNLTEDEKKKLAVHRNKYYKIRKKLLFIITRNSYLKKLWRKELFW